MVSIQSLEMSSAHSEISVDSMLFAYCALIPHFCLYGERNHSGWKELARSRSILTFRYLLRNLGEPFHPSEPLFPHLCSGDRKSYGTGYCVYHVRKCCHGLELRC